MLLGGASEPSYILSVNADDIADNHPREKKTQTQRYIYARQDTVDGSFEIIMLQELMWYHFYIQKFYIYKDAKLQQKFRNRFYLPYKQYLNLVEYISLSKLFDRWCGYKLNNKKVSPVKLLVLGLLCYLSHGWTFDD
jgi:hypothetical protein